jgi:hypothetical protein
LGPKEKDILKKLVPGVFTPPSVYLGDYGSCISSGSSSHTLQRLTDIKGLAEFRWQTQTPESRMQSNKNLRPGREASEFNSALRPTKKGEEIIASLI